MPTARPDQSAMPVPFQPAQSETWVGRSERREAGRAFVPLATQLSPVFADHAISGTTRDLSPEGFFVVAPVGSSLCVGQRYEVGFEGGESLPWAPALGDGCYATVVRTETFQEDGERMIGAGLRFDQPIACL